MTELKRHKSWLSEVEANDPDFALEQAAADTAINARVLLNQAWERCSASGVQKKDLAGKLHVDPSRVSQILNGDGNVRLSTLSKFLGAMGFALELRVTPTAGGSELQRTPSSKRGRRAGTAHAPATSKIYVTKIAHGERTTSKWTVLDETFPIEHTEIGPAMLVGRLASMSNPLQLLESQSNMEDIWAEIP